MSTIGYLLPNQSQQHKRLHQLMYVVFNRSKTLHIETICFIRLKIIPVWLFDPCSML